MINKENDNYLFEGIRIKKVIFTSNKNIRFS